MPQSGPMCSTGAAGSLRSIRRGIPKSPTSTPATSGIFHAATGTRSRDSARKTACSSSCSTTGISPSSARSASPIGSAARRATCYRKISECRRRPSRISPGEVYIAKGPVPPPLPTDPAAGSLNSGALTHRYRLLAGKPVAFTGGTLRLVSEREFPISSTMTGALMRIKPGSLRELHWHPNADEWQYYIKGRARMTVFGSHGRARTDEFDPGDVGYVPQGYGHYIESIGSDDLEVLLALNNGTYESISLTAWMAGNPPELLATNFRVPEAVFAAFPKQANAIP